MCCTVGISWAKELKSSSSLVRRKNHTAVLVSQVLGIINNKRSHLTIKTSFVFLKFFHKSLEFSSFVLKYLTSCITKPNKHRQHNEESGPGNECPLGNKRINQSDCDKTVFDALYHSLISVISLESDVLLFCVRIQHQMSQLFTEAARSSVLVLQSHGTTVRYMSRCCQR